MQAVQGHGCLKAIKRQSLLHVELSTHTLKWYNCCILLTVQLEHVMKSYALRLA